MLDGLIMKGNQIVVPQLLRNEMKKLLHNGHLGVVKMKGQARETIFWPGLNRDINNITNCCEQCLQYQNKQQSERVIPHEIPLVPWTKVGTDIFCLKSKSYLIVVDYTSNFFDISQLPDKLSSTVVTHTKRIFSKFGIPKVVISDNGPEFKGEAYQKLSKTWDFQHLTSSPTYPESNVQVERTIQLVKKTLTKAFCNNEDPYLALLSLRVNPDPYNNTAPATLFLNRPIRSTLPSLNSHHQIVNKKLIRSLKSEGQNLPELHIGVQIRIHDGRGKVIGLSDNPRSYMLLTENGSKIRRNRKHILVDRHKYPDKTQDDCYSLIDLSEETVNNRELHVAPQPNNVNSQDAPNEQFDPIPVEIIPDNNEAEEQVLTTRSGRVINMPSRYGDYETDLRGLFETPE